MLDEIELEIVNAVQINPRASWTLIGSVLGIDPVTAARRWKRLTDSGLAWTTVYPSSDALKSVLVAYIEVECVAGSADTVARQLIDDPKVASIDHITGSADVIVTVFTSDLGDLSRILLETLGTIDGVKATRAHVGTSVHVEGSQWKLRSLSADQQDRLRSKLPRVPGVVPRSIDRRDEPLLSELQKDARTSYSSLAEVMGSSVSTVRRRLDSLIGAQKLIFRCEIAQPLSGWPVSATLWCRVPPARVDLVASQVAALPEARLCSVVTGGPANLLLSVWLRSVSDTHYLQTALTERFTELEVLSSGLTLRQVKRIGRVLDKKQHAVGIVPLRIWTD